MELHTINQYYKRYKEKSLYHRYITNSHIEPLIEKYKAELSVTILGDSVLGKPIYCLEIGTGKKRVLMWSQMHGNESTTTKAVFDLLNTLFFDNQVSNILSECTICIIPILNPDGAQAYTRVNANNIDLNRDAQNRSQPESILLRKLFDKFQPHYCYNLHGQRTIFSAGNHNKSAIVSFLAPAQDDACSITSNRKIAMELINVMNRLLQKEIPNQVGVYDDSFNINCVGDTFQTANVPTILFEAGHAPNDYSREETRRYIYISLLSSLDYIACNKIDGSNYKPYLNIPENEKLFSDIIIRNATLIENGEVVDIGIQYEEVLKDGKIHFQPKIEFIERLLKKYGHREIDANNHVVSSISGNPIAIGNSNDFVILNNEKISLLLE